MPKDTAVSQIFKAMLKGWTSIACHTEEEDLLEGFARSMTRQCLYGSILFSCAKRIFPATKALQN